MFPRNEGIAKETLTDVSTITNPSTFVTVQIKSNARRVTGHHMRFRKKGSKSRRRPDCVAGKKPSVIVMFIHGDAASLHWHTRGSRST